MGFGFTLDEVVTKAVEKCNGTVDRAAEMLFSQMENNTPKFTAERNAQPLVTHTNIK
jgi:hypothetical protein